MTKKVITVIAALLLAGCRSFDVQECLTWPETNASGQTYLRWWLTNDNP